MRTKRNYTIEYREEGEHKEVEIEIDFISNRVMKDFSDLIVMGNVAEAAYNRISDINSILAGEKLTEEQKEQYKQESVRCVDKVMEFNDNGYFVKRFEILKRILIDNGYKNDEKLMSLDFWENCVDPKDQLKFMTLAIYKDVDQKKKLFQQ